MEKGQEARMLSILGNNVSEYKNMPKLASAFGLNSSSCIFSREIEQQHVIAREKDVMNSHGTN